METIVDLDFYSPRWGHNDRYSIHFRDKEIYIGMGAKEARCIQNEDGSIKWSGHNQGIGNPLLNILSDDKIYPPSPFINALISAWNSWKTHELSDEELKTELDQLSNWVNESSHNKPDSEYWIKLF